MIALDEFKKLSIEDRYRIVDELERSIEEERDSFQESPELIAEIMRRDAEYQANPSTGVRWEDLMARLLARHG